VAATGQHYDIAIVGAGAVGGTLAYALANIGYSVVLIEKTATTAQQQPAFDERHLGFSRSTRIAFEGMGLWQEMAEVAVTISRIQVSSKGRFGTVMMDARDEGLESLGYVLPAREIGRVLIQAIDRQPAIQLLAPAEVVSVAIREHAANLQLDYQGERLELAANLLIGADGASSRIRELVGIDTTRWEYGESAVIANLDVESLEPGLAHERFIDEGAIALLPRNDAGYAAVCSVDDSDADRLMQMQDSEFADYLRSQMGSRLSAITAVGKRYRYPLALVRARQCVREHLVLVGNAAHYIHPVAAQGFNLSMRDVTALVETLQQAHQQGGHPGDLSLLQQYADWREQDERIMVAFTDGLIRLFINPLLPVALMRQQGLLALRHLPGLRKLFTRAVTGRLGKQAGLMRGISLQGEPLQ
jgi:2-octaprenyl-6-methoxyphenol hydroxylase